jgi:hypothetical protein
MKTAPFFMSASFAWISAMPVGISGALGAGAGLAIAIAALAAAAGSLCRSPDFPVVG